MLDAEEVATARPGFQDRGVGHKLSQRIGRPRACEGTSGPRPIAVMAVSCRGSGAVGDVNRRFARLPGNALAFDRPNH